jgi:putative CocE/NonD family hydrolase
MRISFQRVALASVVCAVSALGTLYAQGLEYVRANYTKYEYQIPMRDGKKLFTAVYAPKDTSQKYPILFIRTPYSVGPYGADSYPGTVGPSDKYGKEGFIFVHQDVRGRYMSEGEFVDVRPYRAVKKGPNDIDETSDTYDTIEWLLKNVKNHNGRVGIWGISYPGFYAAMGAIDAHPAVKAVSPQAPVSDWFLGDDWHHNGALFLPHTFGFYSSFGRPSKPETGVLPPAGFRYGTPDGYEFFLGMGPLKGAEEKHFKGQIEFWKDLMKHGTYDAFWKERSLPPQLRNIKPAVMTVGGWFDAEDLWGALHVYRSIEANNPRAYNTLVMGPWSHGGWSGGDATALGDIRFGSKTGVFFRDEIELAFFNYFLKDKGPNRLPEAYLFETGKNEWRKFDQWPPKEAQPKKLYFQAGGKLSFDAPEAGAGAAFDEYVSDPAKPVPFLSGTHQGMAPEYMLADQRFAASRTDVLTYRSDVLDRDVTIAGPVTPSLFVSTSGTDSDWVVKLIDVYPNDYPDNEPNPAGVRMGGYQQLVRGEPMRGKFRNSFEKPEPFEPGKVTKVEFAMPDVLHTFRRGHRIMVQVQSSWFPLVDRNPQKFVDIYGAAAADFQKATERVYHSRDAASALAFATIE